MSESLPAGKSNAEQGESGLALPDLRDPALVERLLADAEPSLRQALWGLIPPTFRSALDIDDVIQVTFIEAFLRIGTFIPRGPGSFEAWLTRMARNNLKDAVKALRAEKRVPRHRMVTIGAGSDSYEGLLNQLGSSSATPSRAAAGAESRNLVEDALGKLPPDYARVVRLMDIDAQTAPQAASALGRSVGAVYMLRVRAHALLREILGGSGRYFSSGA